MHSFSGQSRSACRSGSARVVRAVLVLVAILPGCTGKRSGDAGVAAPYRVDEIRRNKDLYFRSGDSPLNDSLKAAFAGLSYFEEDSTFRYLVRVTPYESPRRVDMLTSRGTWKHYIEYGYVEFDRERTQRLNVFKPDPPIEGHEDYLFVPFKDATSGGETYESGRYLELEPVPDTRDVFLLDFNLAYNPWCAYSDRYNCPYPPPENHLSVAIRAGEKKFTREHSR